MTTNTNTNTCINENQTYYVVMVNGNTVSDRCTNIHTAEFHRQQLDEDIRSIAHVVAVNEHGHQILMG